MLVLSRKIGETVTLVTPAGRIHITLCGTQRGSAKIGLDAPHCVQIIRGELDDGSQRIGDSAEAME